MTYNLLGFNKDVASIMETLRKSDADLIGFQEINPQVAAAIEKELASEYPYQALEPQDGVRGSGIISRYPMSVAGQEIPDDHWVSPPSIVRVKFEGEQVTVVSFHATAHPGQYERREEQSRKLAAYAAGHEAPLIMLGDLNASSTNAAYSIITEVLGDAWREAGFGFGHTFPGASRAVSPASARPELLGIAVPRWLVRIDYVFYSEHWKPISAEIGRFDGYSDHRPVIVELVLR